jgi:hypothetical protein
VSHGFSFSFGGLAPRAFFARLDEGIKMDYPFAYKQIYSHEWNDAIGLPGAVSRRSRLRKIVSGLDAVGASSNAQRHCSARGYVKGDQVGRGHKNRTHVHQP